MTCSDRTIDVAHYTVYSKFPYLVSFIQITQFDEQTFQRGAVGSKTIIFAELSVVSLQPVCFVQGPSENIFIIKFCAIGEKKNEPL